MWVKTNPMPNFRGVRFTNAHETLIWAQKARGKRYTFHHHSMKALNDGLQMRSDWYLPLCTGGERIKANGEKAHATQKPEALLYRVILSSSNVGDVVLDPFLGSGTTAVVARKLHRRWIGIERDPSYVQIAERRLKMVQQEMFVPEVFELQDKRAAPRVPFAALLESGLVHPGQELYFGQRGSVRATVLTDGQIRSGELVGSIHELAKSLQGAPCNGWDHWFYLDRQTGERKSINDLRQQYRQSSQLGKTAYGDTQP